MITQEPTTFRPRAAVPAAMTALATAAVVTSWLSVSLWPSARALPDRLTDQEYWNMVVSFSEPGGTFQSNGAVRSDNLVSNEASFQHVIPALQHERGSGAYLGVGPEQNLTYITALKPPLAFIVDIRRGNMLLHLLYKALIELSDDRIAFLSRLFSRARPAGLTLDASAAELLDAFRTEPRSETQFTATLQAVLERLARTHGFALSKGDGETIESALSWFSEGGPDTRWDSSGARWIPSYAELMTATDREGREHGFLSSEERYGVLRQYESVTRIVALVGDFAGRKTLRAVGRYLKKHRATVGAFYTSNVESYLFRGLAWRTFYENVSALPIDEHSLFVRTHFMGVGFSRGQPDYETSTVLDPIQSVQSAFDNGRIRSYGDLLW